MDGADPCVHLEWDSRFFGRRIGRVAVAALTPDQIARVCDWADTERVDCLYCLLDADDRDAARIAERAGFRRLDTRVTLERSLEEGVVGTPADDHVGAWREEDLPALRAIARASHSTSRFYLDPNFPRERCDALYETWIENSCAGWADDVLVYRAGAVLGYVTCHLDPGRVGRIGLFAVAAKAQGRGIGQRLLRASLSWFSERDRTAVRVATQQQNQAALHSYERAGFHVSSVEYWYHRWSTDVPREAMA